MGHSVGEYVAACVVDVVGSDEPVLLGALLRMGDAEGDAGRFEGMRLAGQCEGERAQVEETARVPIARVGPGSRRGALVVAVDAARAPEAQERLPAIDVLDAGQRPVWMALALAALRVVETREIK